MGRRAYDLLRGYVNYEWDRIRNVDGDASAAQELQEGLDAPNPRNSRPTSATSAQAHSGSLFSVTPPTDPEERKQLARKILGVAEAADFPEVRRCFERINRRADPGNFPKDSPEANQASEIQRRVHWAYGVLTENVDSTEKRFRSLEI